MQSLDMPGGAGSDIFLHVQTKRAGKIKGESTTQGHADDIEVRGWRWGAQSGSAIGATAATARRQYRPLVVVKGVDSASTGLLAALATNDEVREAKLTMRKAGGDALDYYCLTLNNARVVDIVLDVDAQGRPVETVTFSFTKVAIDYKRQQGTGLSSGSYTFQDEVLPA
jgi:type VI secretion system secreted protein Hcp